MASFAPSGFSLAKRTSTYNEYYVTEADPATYAVGDPVATSGAYFTGRLPDARPVQGMPHAKAAISGGRIRGVIVGILPGPGGAEGSVLPSIKTRPYVILVDDNPLSVFSIQVDNALPLTAGGMYANFTAGAPGGSVSGFWLDSASLNARTGDLLIQRIVENTGPNSRALVTFVLREDAQVQVSTLPEPLRPVLLVGGDHPYAQWLRGMGPAYREAGLLPFCAINTDTSLGGTTAPTGAGEMASWSQVAELQKMGVEIASHGARHIQSWSRINTGIRIRYTGVAASPTVAISSSALTLTGNGGSENAALAFSTYTTLSALATQINAQGGGVWTATLADELAGTEQSGNLLVVAARNVASSTNNQYFAAGGGIVLRYVGRAHEQVYAIRNSSSRVEIYCDGVRRGNFDLTSASYDTLTELVAGINALAITGLTAALCDNRRAETSTFLSYLQGDESSLNLKPMQVEIQEKRSTVDAGLPRWYMIERQMVRSAAVAAANGITLTHFAQPGDDFHQYLTDHTSYESFRGNPDARFICPLQTIAAKGDPRFTLMQTTADNSAVGWNLARYQAVVNALCDSPGFVVNLNTHKVIPDGSSSYTFPNGDAYGELTEADFVAASQYAGAKVASGLLANMPVTEFHRKRSSFASPKNYVFNPKFKNDGTTLLNVTDSGFKIPGWYLVTPSSVFSAVSVANDALTCTTTASTATVFAQQELLLEPGKTYMLSVLVEYTAYTSGNGVILALQSPRGQVPGLFGPDSNATFLGQRVAAGAGNGTRMQRVDLLVTIPQTAALSKPKAVSVTAGPYNLGSSPAQIKINIDAKAQLELNVAGSTPTATTADEVAAAINAGIAASSSYPSEYRNAASVVAGKVVVRGPYASPEERYDSGYGIQIDSGTTNSATTTVFGASVVRAPGFWQGPTDSTRWPWLLTLQSAVVGAYTVSAPQVMEVIGS